MPLADKKRMRMNPMRCPAFPITWSLISYKNGILLFVEFLKGLLEDRKWSSDKKRCEKERCKVHEEEER